MGMSRIPAAVLVNSVIVPSCSWMRRMRMNPLSRSTSSHSSASCSLGRTPVKKLEAAGEFPRRIRLGRSRVGWSLQEVLIWMEQRKAERDQQYDTDASD